MGSSVADAHRPRAVAPMENTNDSMEDWEPRLATIEARLVEWHAKFERELAAVCKEKKLTGWFKKPSRAELDAAAVEARRRTGVEVLGEAALLFDRLCAHYSQSLPQERAKIRARVGSHETVFDRFWDYVQASPELVRTASDGPALATSLAAISIDDLRAEFHELNVVVGRLILAATAAGIPWKPYFHDAAKISNPGTGGGGAHMREYLLDFEHSAYFKVEVAPKLRAVSKEAQRRAPATNRA